MSLSLYYLFSVSFLRTYILRLFFTYILCLFLYLHSLSLFFVPTLYDYFLYLHYLFSSYLHSTSLFVPTFYVAFCTYILCLFSLYLHSMTLFCTYIISFLRTYILCLFSLYLHSLPLSFYPSLTSLYLSFSHSSMTEHCLIQSFLVSSTFTFPDIRINLRSCHYPDTSFTKSITDRFISTFEQ